MTIVEKTQVYEKVPTKELIHENEKTDVPSYGYGVRHVQTIILFICMIIAYIAKAHLGVSIVAMTNAIKHANINNSLVNITMNNTLNSNGTDGIDFIYADVEFDDNNTSFDVASNMTSNEDSIWNVYRTYDWGKSIQDTILGAFFIGYGIAMFPTGMLCQRFGGKLPLQALLLVNGIVSLATPTVAVWGGGKAVFCCRVIQGLTQAGLYPCTHTLLSKWVPISERATLSSFVYTGTLLGAVLAFQIGGIMVGTAAGWPGTFWITGVLCLGAFLLLTILGADSPADHKTISDSEKNYILGMIDDGIKKKALKTPWKHIVKSKPLWANFITHTASGVCFVFFFTQIPSYMHYILGYDVKNSGLLSSLPYVASAAANMAFGLFSDMCINKGILSTKTTRIVCNSMAQVGSALCLVLVSFTYNSSIAVLLLILAMTLFAGVHSGWMVNYIDLSPNFSGSLMATGNTCSTVTIIILPILISNVITDVYDRHQWHIVMYVIAAFTFATNLLFAVFMSSDRQPWDQVEEQEDIEMEKSMEAAGIKNPEHKCS